MNTATRMGSDILGKGDMTSSNKITGVHDEEKVLVGFYLCYFLDYE